MNRVRNTAQAVAAIVLGLAWPGVALAQEDLPEGSAEAGMEAFHVLGCWTCHGFSGQGTSAGPRLTDPMLPHDAFLEQMRHPRDVMPPYEAAILPDQNVADIYVFLASIPAAQRTAEETPLLQDYLSN